MAIQSRFSIVNPLLKTHYAIFTSVFLGLVFLLIILEQLGIDRFWLSHIMVAMPTLLTALIGVAAFSNTVEDFYVSGRRVPAAFNGFNLAITSLGAAGLLGITGVLLFIGFDGFCLTLGWMGGFFLMAVLFTPYLRKVGAYTLPSFFGLRFESQALRITSTFILIIPVMLILAAELKVGVFAASLVIGMPYNTLVWAALATILVSILLGGMRSLTWMQCAQFIVVLIGFLVPITILAVLMTNLPIPQLTYGTLLDDLAKLELNAGLASLSPFSLDQALPREAPSILRKPFMQTFGLIDRSNFLLLMLCVMAGIATLPSLLIRASTTPGVFEARKSVGWGIFLLGIVLISAPAYAVFVKLIVLKDLVGATIDQLPGWAQALINSGIIVIKDNNQDLKLGIREMAIARDGVMLMLPIITEFPFVLIVLTVSAAIAAALASGAARIVTISAMLSNDLFYGVFFKSSQPLTRVIMMRIAMIATALAAGWIAQNQNYDGFRLVCWALALTGSTFFPVLVLSIWWKRCTSSGAIAGVITGFLVSFSYIWITEFAAGGKIFGIDGILASVFGIPLSFGMTILISLITQKPILRVDEFVEDMRMPGGETLSDRATRLSRRRRGAVKNI